MIQKRYVQGEKGFTLIEVLVVAGIVAILAGILVPLILKEIDESRISRAYGDIRSISAAMLVFKKDTGMWPDMDNNCQRTVTLLRGVGNMPQDASNKGFVNTVESTYNDHLVQTSGCYNNWKGAYIAWVTADPWGNSYITNADAFRIDSGPIWILSAGPDGIVDTPSTGDMLLNDDIGLRLR